MIGKYHRWNKQRRNRYIFIIDRRHPENVKNNNLAKEPVINAKKPWIDQIYMIAPKEYRNEKANPLCRCGAKLIKIKPSMIKNKSVKCIWCNESVNDKYEIFKCPKEDGYILCSNECEKARPETHCKISTNWEAFPESCLSLSKSYILLNPNSDLSVPITIDDALHGHKWAFSYHILAQNNITAYFYHNAGGTLFELNDIKWAWSGWFEKVNGRQQELDKSVIEAIKLTNAKELTNAGFQEFEKQCNNIQFKQNHL